MNKTSSRRRAPSLSFLFEHSFEMDRVFNDFMSVIAANMPGYLMIAVHDSNKLIGGDERQSSPYRSLSENSVLEDQLRRMSSSFHHER
jgi:hypothetical protein